MNRPRVGETVAHEEHRQLQLAMTIGIDLGDFWSRYCTLNQEGEVVGRGRFRTTPKAIEKWFTDLPPARIAMKAGTHSIWISRAAAGAWPSSRRGEHACAAGDFSHGPQGRSDRC
jgi:hypothetical protein